MTSTEAEDRAASLRQEQAWEHLGFALRNLQLSQYIVKHWKGDIGEAKHYVALGWYGVARGLAAADEKQIDRHGEFLEAIPPSVLKLPGDMTRDKWAEAIYEFTKQQNDAMPLTRRPREMPEAEAISVHLDILKYAVKAAAYRFPGGWKWYYLNFLPYQEWLAFVLCLAVVFAVGKYAFNEKHVQIVQGTVAPSTSVAELPKEPWKMVLYDNIKFKGEPLKVSNISFVDFDWSDAVSIAPGKMSDNFSVQFETCLTLEKETAVYFYFKSDDTTRLRVFQGENVLADVNNGGGKAEQRLYLKAGVYRIELDYVELQNLANVALKAEIDGGGISDLPVEMIHYPGGDGEVPGTCESPRASS